jgi:hypothetical protein
VNYKDNHSFLSSWRVKIVTAWKSHPMYGSKIAPYIQTKVMKGVCIWTTLLLIPCLVFSQDPPTGVSKIILTNSLTQEENYREVGRVLLDNDFVIDYADKELGFVNTEYFIASYSDDPKLRIVVRDGEIIVTGIIRSIRIDKTILYYDLKNSGLGSRKSFQIMNEIAMKFPHDKVRYGFVKGQKGKS